MVEILIRKIGRGDPSFANSKKDLFLCRMKLKPAYLLLMAFALSTIGGSISLGAQTEKINEHYGGQSPAMISHDCLPSQPITITRLADYEVCVLINESPDGLTAYFGDALSSEFAFGVMNIVSHPEASPQMIKRSRGSTLNRWQNVINESQPPQKVELILRC